MRVRCARMLHRLVVEGLSTAARQRRGPPGQLPLTSNFFVSTERLSTKQSWYFPSASVPITSWTASRIPVYPIHMKRTNLVLNEDLLEEATRLSGERTYSRTVERALEEFVRRAKARRILELAGSGLWQGDLALMREDRGVYRTKRRGSR